MGREREKKKFSPEFRSHSTRARKFQKQNQKIKKPLSGIISSQNGISQAEKDKKKIQSRIPFIRPGQENCKKNCKKYHKTEKHTSDIISSQNGMRQVEKERKQFLSQIPFLLDLGKKIPKKIAQKFIKLKNLTPALFFAKTG